MVNFKDILGPSCFDPAKMLQLYVDSLFSADGGKLMDAKISIRGPYKHRKLFRLEFWTDGRREVRSYKTEGMARAVKYAMMKKLNSLSLNQCVKEWEEHLMLSVKPVTIRHYLKQLKPYVSVLGEKSIHEVTAEAIETVYAERCRSVSVASHRTDLKCLRMLYRWLIDKGYVAENTAAKVKPIGRINRGKKQLHVSEAKRYIDHLLDNITQDYALALSINFLCGLRAGEVVALNVRDVDFESNELYIEQGKTLNAQRRVKIPTVLQPILSVYVAGKAPTDKVFPKSYGWLWWHNKRILKELGLPQVCPHSFRGLHASLSRSAGSTPDVVAACLGHSSYSITSGHYTAPGIDSRQQQDNVVETFVGVDRMSNSESEFNSDGNTTD